MSKRGADKLPSSKFTLGAEGSVAAGPAGRTATAQTDAQMHAEILSRSRSQGLFAGIALEGATLLPNAHGQNRVESKPDYIEIEVVFRELQAATANNSEFLTSVRWASAPEGRTANLGEVLLNGTNRKLELCEARNAVQIARPGRRLKRRLRTRSCEFSS